MAKVRKRAQSGRRDVVTKKRKVKGAAENGDVVVKNKRDEEILSEEEEEDERYGEAPVSDGEDEEVDVETADEKRLRIAKAYLDRTRQAAADAEVWDAWFLFWNL